MNDKKQPWEWRMENGECPSWGFNLQHRSMQTHAKTRSTFWTWTILRKGSLRGNMKHTWEVPNPLVDSSVSDAPEVLCFLLIGSNPWQQACVELHPGIDMWAERLVSNGSKKTKQKANLDMRMGVIVRAGPDGEGERHPFIESTHSWARFEAPELRRHDLSSGFKELQLVLFRRTSSGSLTFRSKKPVKKLGLFAETILCVFNYFQHCDL